MRNSPTADQKTLDRIRYIHGQMSSPTSQIIVHHIMCATRVCRPPHSNGILSSTIQTGWALFSINTRHTAIHTHLISQFACKQSTFQSVKGQNQRIKSRSGDGSRHLGMWRTIVLHISWSTVILWWKWCNFLQANFCAKTVPLWVKYVCVIRSKIVQMRPMKWLTYLHAVSCLGSQVRFILFLSFIILVPVDEVGWGHSVGQHPSVRSSTRPTVFRVSWHSNKNA